MFEHSHIGIAEEPQLPGRVLDVHHASATWKLPSKQPKYEKMRVLYNKKCACWRLVVEGVDFCFVFECVVNLMLHLLPMLL